MTLIKRYPNRKLYDTEASRYVTLDDVAALIQRGREVQVVDHATGEDLTALTLSQVILEQAKQRGGSLPLSVLAGLIRAGGDLLHGGRALEALPFDEQVLLRALARRGAPTRAEFQRLAEQVEALAAEVDRVTG